MPRLEQTTRVLKLYALDPDVGVTYVAADDDTDLITTAVSVTHDDYDELGEADTVTVTIRPGDRLNVEKPAEEAGPQYRLTVDVDGDRITDQPLEDPFVTTTLTIAAEDLRDALEAGQDAITVVVRVDGTRAALAHVFRPMDLTPNDAKPVTIEGAEATA